MSAADKSLVERLRAAIRPDTAEDDDPIIHRTLVDQDGKVVGSGQYNASEIFVVEAYRDECDRIWMPPTAYAYAKVCAVKDRQQAEIERLRELGRELLDHYGDTIPDEILDEEPVIAFRAALKEGTGR